MAQRAASPLTAWGGFLPCALCPPPRKSSRPTRRSLLLRGAWSGTSARTWSTRRPSSTAFQTLLDQVGRQFGWTLIPQLTDTVAGRTIRPDGTFRDDYYITRGYWEAKDTHDNLETEIQRKIAKGYPLSNTIFEDTRQGYLYQDGQLAMKAELDGTAGAGRPAECLLRLHRAGPRGLQQGGRRVPAARARSGPRARSRRSATRTEQPALHRGVRPVLRVMPHLVQPEPAASRRSTKCSCSTC